MLRADFKEVRALRAATPITITESRCGLSAVARTAAPVSRMSWGCRNSTATPFAAQRKRQDDGSTGFRPHSAPVDRVSPVVSPARNDDFCPDFPDAPGSSASHRSMGDSEGGRCYVRSMARPPDALNRFLTLCGVELTETSTRHTCLRLVMCRVWGARAAAVPTTRRTVACTSIGIRGHGPSPPTKNTRRSRW